MFPSLTDEAFAANHFILLWPLLLDPTEGWLLGRAGRPDLDDRVRPTAEEVADRDQILVAQAELDLLEGRECRGDLLVDRRRGDPHPAGRGLGGREVAQLGQVTGCLPNAKCQAL